uniref:Uncharacterized protein n=1 Tax=Eptatretus burgeri TaxID=7764 RepID=A0A8C4WXT8_EPTBU
MTCKEETRFAFAAFSCTVTFFQSYIITVMSFLIPFYLIMILDIATCFLPLWGDIVVDRLSAKLTLLLTFSFCLYTLGEVIPGNMSGCVPLIVQVFVGALFFIAIDVMETIFIIYCYSWKSYPWMSSCLLICRKTSGKSGSKSNLVEDNDKGGSANDEVMEARRLKSCKARAETADKIFFWIYLMSLFGFINYTMYLWFQGHCQDNPSQHVISLESYSPKS